MVNVRLGLIQSQVLTGVGVVLNNDNHNIQFNTEGVFFYATS